MLLAIWRYITLTLTSLLRGMTFCHVLELPAKMKYPSSMYLQLHRTLYVAFGPPNIGAFIEIGAIVAALVLVFLVRAEKLAFWLTLFGAVCLLLGIVVFFLFIEPSNVALKNMPLEIAPPDFTRWRDHWEYAHAAHFVCHLLGLSALIFSALVDSHKLAKTRKRVK